jgi:steroid 5-alpha reductase family enzyme
VLRTQIAQTREAELFGVSCHTLVVKGLQSSLAYLAGITCESVGKRQLWAFKRIATCLCDTALWQQFSPGAL